PESDRRRPRRLVVGGRPGVPRHDHGTNEQQDTPDLAQTLPHTTPRLALGKILLTGYQTARTGATTRAGRGALVRGESASFAGTAVTLAASPTSGPVADRSDADAPCGPRRTGAAIWHGS